MKHDPRTLAADAKVAPRLAGFCTDAELAAELDDRARRRSLGADLLTGDDVAAEIGARLDGRQGQYGRLATDLGIAQSSLSNVLGGRFTIGEALALRLGFRKVTRFERVR